MPIIHSVVNMPTFAETTHKYAIIHSKWRYTSMKRRTFLKTASAAIALRPWLHAQLASDWIDLTNCAVVTPAPRPPIAVQVFIEEAEKRCGIRWQTTASLQLSSAATIHAFTRQSAGKAEPKLAAALHAAQGLREEGFVIRIGKDASGTWIAVVGADDRGLLFGIGQLLRLIHFDPQDARVEAARLTITAQPTYPLRGHQLGYRPKTNSYDGWTIAMWDQYIRDLALFGTNAIELVPPRSDDARTSPLFPLPPEKMMVEMSRIADHYGLDVWIWYPALDKDYSNPATVDFSLAEWGRIFASLPRVDAVFVPGGDPGSTPPQYLFPLLEKQKATGCGSPRRVSRPSTPTSSSPSCIRTAPGSGSTESSSAQCLVFPSKNSVRRFPPTMLSGYYSQRLVPVSRSKLGHRLRSRRRPRSH